ncbi:NAD-dependent epimerase/dehydratase family protein [Nocardia sp. NBC_01730]|uniref:NAD-dependent epimerase/dehydratase family protein n=1 Tax=Nocardia sp. NBC_01730 TaxID=2975998 RepID=UPI002E0E56A3|nr:NAD-dependent epimerase/dehydratase family protein [Nocardia sp. NBC_01730]
MRVLVLGGSRFLGRAVVAAAVAQGIDITCFRRGSTGEALLGARLIRGDRTRPDDVARLAEAGPWDAVIDTSAYIPRETLGIAQMLERVVGQYVLVSTVSAYRGWPVEPITEESRVFDCASDAEHGSASYGALKAGCEAAVLEAIGPDRTVILRPGVILGPHDYLGRLPWWLRRIARGGRVLAPGNPDRRIQPIDVRDAADFAIHAAGLPANIYNLTSPGAETMGDLLDACRLVTGAHAELDWATDEIWLAAQGLTPWTDLPLWRIDRGVWQVDSTRARDTGLVARPIAMTVADTWEWLSSDASDTESDGENGISAEREQELLSLWDKKR